jgi:DNA-binding IclR family transcriptional regulator
MDVEQNPETKRYHFGTGLALIRQRGYALDRQESVEGACCIGFPLRNCTGMMIGAISASMKASRFNSLNQTYSGEPRRCGGGRTFL